MNADLDVLDQLVSTLLERHQQSSSSPTTINNNAARESTRLSRLKSLSFRKRRNSSNKRTSLAAANELNLFSSGIGVSGIGSSSSINNNNGQSAAAAMPTILESGNSNLTIKPQPLRQSPTHSLDRAHGSAGVRQIINSIKNAPQRLSQSIDHQRLNDNDVDDETSNLAKNMLD